MISDSDVEKIEQAIVTNAPKSDQWAIAYGLVMCARALNTISSTVGYEGMIATRNAGEAISTSIQNLASAVADLPHHLSD